MKLPVMLIVLGAILGATLLVGSARAAGEKLVVFGGDTTEAERQELMQLLQIDAATRLDIVTTPEMVRALAGTGLPAAETDLSISSSSLTCLNRGDGLTVRTQNITRIPAPVYANALVTAGVGDAAVLIAAPSARPVTGETALVGVLKAFPQCQAGKPPEPERVALAYEQVARTVALAGQQTDLATASAALLEAAQPVMQGQVSDDAAIGASLDRALQRAGVALDPAQRTDLIGFLRRIGGLDYGAYARGYAVEQVSPTEVRVRPTTTTAPAAMPAAPAMAAAPAAPPATAAAPNAPVQGQAAAAAGPSLVPAPLTGEILRTGDALTLRAGDQERELFAAPGATVTRDGKPATLADLRPRDRVTVTTNPDGTAQRIEATSVREGTSNPAAWLVPLVLGLLLVGVLAWLLRPRAPFILTRRTTVGR